MKEELIEWEVPQPAVRVRLMVEQLSTVRQPATRDDLRKACEAVGLVVQRDEELTEAKAVELGLTVRTAARKRYGLGGADAQALEGALRTTERDRNVALHERDEALGEAANLRAQLGAERKSSQAELATLRAQLAEVHEQWPRSSAEHLERIATLEQKLAALTPPEGRATDEELEQIGRDVYRHSAAFTDIAKAVAARVRRERPACLVERLVAAKAKFSAFERESDATWTVHVCLPGTGGYTTNVTDLPAAEVPATLARLAGLGGK